MMPRPFGLLICWLLLCMPLSLAAEEAWQRPAYILDSLIEVGLRSEYGPDPMIVRKWREPVRVYIEHQLPEQALRDQLVDVHLKQLADITGHSISRVGSSASANVELIFLRQQDLAGEWAARTDGERIPQGTLCLARIRTERDGTINRALVAIPVDRARLRGKLISCIVEELTQLLGLPNDSEKVFPSIFNDRSTNQLLSGLDLVLLRLLYDPRIQPGMSEQELRRSGARILDEFKRQGVIAGAEREVLQGELYRMLGYTGAGN